MDNYNRFLQRLSRLKIRPDENSRIESMLKLLNLAEADSTEDQEISAILDNHIAVKEAEKLAFPFLELPADSGLEDGDIEICTTRSDIPIKVSYLDSRPNQINHTIVEGKTGSGKTHFMANMSACASESCYTLVLDSAHQFRKFSDIRTTHDVIRADDLRINLWDGVNGLSPHISDQIVNHELCSCFNVQYGELEIGEETSEQRAQGTRPNINSIANGLYKKQKSDRFSRRFYYRDSALLMLGNLSRSTPIFKCAKGIDIETALFKGNIVIECGNMLPAFQRFFVRFLFEYMGMLALAGRNSDKPLIFVLDEGQYIVTG